VKSCPVFRRNGFTMIELLVGLAIVGVLAAVLLSALSGVKDKAETALCSQNLKQIGVAVLTFAGENEGFCPMAGGSVPHGSTDSTTGKPSWTEQLEPVLGEDRKVFRCPGSARALANNKTYGYFLGAHAAYVDAGGSFAALNIKRIQSPSRYILGGDVTTGAFLADDADKDDYTQNPFAAKPAFHAGRTNLLFADGSVRGVDGFDSATMEITYSGTGASYP
jgi:prepilin-type N-terminal cleavage/methylation domain-containing protein/prepilin-type processing-associated H-X9-DG protein